MEILTFPEAATPPALRAQVLELQEEAWPYEGAPTLSADLSADRLSHDPALNPRTMLLVDRDSDGAGGGEGTVLAALDILSKEIVHAGRRYAAAGLSTVATRGSHRGRGHGRRLVSAAREEMADGKTDVGLFTCARPLQAFYESAGWQVLPGTVLIGGTPEAPFPSDRPGFDKVTMACFFSEESRRREISFHDARIQLYPGEIDKLW
ncbi:GNAT family N-acetyltransferase [Streptomyces sp. NPDC051776]|uniref:GNAT family N-acetyltransferase n=1 Tax=Streptomyces sp. NPDC051776 TaxID=3155414 RepID=UPI00341F50A5